MKLTAQQISFLDKVVKGKWTLNSGGLVDVVGDVVCDDLIELQEFPVKFGKVSGSFQCSGCTGLRTLEGAPREVRWGFVCVGCTSLQTLAGAPQKVGDRFICENCTGLTTLEGAPREVGRFDCSGCTGLTTLDGAPREVGRFYCWDCTGLQTLEGAPQKVEDSFDCSGCTGLPPEQLNLIKDYDGDRIKWEEVHKLLNRPKLLKGRELGLF